MRRYLRDSSPYGISVASSVVVVVVVVMCNTATAVEEVIMDVALGVVGVECAMGCCVCVVRGALWTKASIMVVVVVMEMAATATATANQAVAARDRRQRSILMMLSVYYVGCWMINYY